VKSAVSRRDRAVVSRPAAAVEIPAGLKRDGLGQLRFVLLPGQRHDSIGTEPLIQDIDFDFAALIADKAFDNNSLRATLNERGALGRPRLKGQPSSRNRRHSLQG
jgi:hypothetical protein